MRFVTFLGAAATALSLAQPTLAADAAKGKELFGRCAKCHSVTGSADDAALVGPSLKGVYGRKAAALEDFRYSGAMRKADITWNDKELKEYITDPQAKVPGNRMALTGSLESGEVDDIIAYLKTLK